MKDDKIYLGDDLRIDAKFCNDNPDAIIDDGVYEYQAKRLIRAWNKYLIELKKIRRPIIENTIH